MMSLELCDQLEARLQVLDIPRIVDPPAEGRTGSSDGCSAFRQPAHKLWSMDIERHPAAGKMLHERIEERFDDVLRQVHRHAFGDNHRRTIVWHCLQPA